VKKAFAVASWQFSLLFALLLTLFYNQPLWNLVLTQSTPGNLNNLLFDASFFLFVLAVLNILLNLVAFRHLQKPLAIFVVLSASGVLYFMNSYNIVIDKTMVQNLVETDPAEVRDLLNLKLFLYILLLGLLPALVIAKLPIRYAGALRELRNRGLAIVASVLVILIVAAGFYKDYASFFRNNREVRNLAVPTNYLYYSVKFLSGAQAQEPQRVDPVGADAQLNPIWQQVGRKVVTIVVLGETARAQNFSINGYARDTNPELAKLPILNFKDTASCGTATAVSVPCMFSNLDREEYSDEKGRARENVLDVLGHAGLNLLWRENNSGCKGVCNRIPREDRSVFCNGADEDSCFDEAMLTRLDDYLASVEGGAVIVLHQQGSHGPAYWKRYPQAFARFTPVCDSNDLSSCAQQSIVNAYDNTILYTDHFLAQVIAYLQARSDRYATAMLYMSDHGESLGENNLYLHGLPYFMAPEQQTRVPFVAWLSDSYRQAFALDEQCLEQKQQLSVSHDNLFHSLLGLMAVDSSVYQADKDLFGSCRRSQ